jgi:hypothetical protein
MSETADLAEDLVQLHPLPLQAAGHPASIFRDERTSGRVLKPVSERERRFYDEATAMAEWRAVLPEYFGATHSHDHQLLITLQDLTFHFRRACVLDLKIGRSSVAEDADDAKRADMHAKDITTTSHSLGLRICGMHVFDPRLGEHVARRKSWGKRLTDDTFRAGLHAYFNVAIDDNVALQPNTRICAVLRRFVARLDQIAALMRSQTQFRFYSSSLLFVYEGDNNKNNSTDETADDPVSLSMIDMAHVFPFRADDGVGDNGYSDALDTLRTHLLAILAIEESLQVCGGV